MAGRWNDDLERYWQERDRQRSDDRYDAYGMSDGRERWSGGENRTFERTGERGSDRGRVFGERDTGAGYNQSREDGRYTQRPDEDRYGRGGWQDPDYQGVSPAMQRGDYETGYRANPTDHGGHGYGARGARGRHGEGRRFGSHEADQRFQREMRGPGATYTGGTDGYDYERGYGDGGRPDDSGLEDRAREAGEFFRRTGRRISNWFTEATGEGPNSGDRQRYEDYRGARGLGPKGYKRSDERISDDVHQGLSDDAWLDASHINVAVSQGEVTLSGAVMSREAKHRAERIVEDLSGVTHVQNNLRVQSTGYATSSGRSYGETASDAGASSSQIVKDVTDGATAPAPKRN